jgi:DNA-directed RNA polymerase subunit M/transcription elongation factor TFIIS
MHFCPVCSNMYYISINSDNPNQLVYYCRKCGNEDANLASQNVCVSNIQLKKSEEANYNINPYTKFDPTLPRINTILCPNPECVTNKEKGRDRDIVYIRYDNVRMKYVYLCCDCDTVWEINDLANR